MFRGETIHSSQPQPHFGSVGDYSNTISIGPNDRGKNMFLNKQFKELPAMD